VSDPFIFFRGTANPALADAIVRELGVRLGASTVERFPDGEIAVRLLESVRRKDVFLVESLSPPVNDHLVELLTLADACRRAAASRITAIVPYFGYGRSDKRNGREPITARVVADLFEVVGITHVVTIDPHTPQLEGFFHVPVDSLSAMSTLCEALRQRPPSELVVVAPDAGRVKLATDYAQCLGVPLAVLHKRRAGPLETRVTHVVGDVSGRACVIIDDIISTGGTMNESIRALLEAGARREMVVMATHGLLLRGAREKLDPSIVHEVLVTDTIARAETDWPQLRVVSVAPLLARALKQLLADGSIRDLDRA
jgi:ribose-phosphate pyrophosphokinase